MEMSERQARRAKEYSDIRAACEKKSPVEASAEKKTRLFELAWEYGHSTGQHEVEMYYDELADLLR